MTALLEAPLNEGRHRDHRTYHKALLAPDWEWRPYAACQGIDPVMFIPDRNDPRTMEAARRICLGCPVREHCREHAIVNHEYGMWGATTDAERRTIRRRRRLKAAPRLGPGPEPAHHSEARHRWSQRHKLPACPECSMATTAARQERRRRLGTDKVTEKTCTLCEKRKPAKEFNSKKNNRDGLNNKCRTCQREHYRTWYAGRLYGVKVGR